MENSFNFEQASYADLYNEAKRLNGLVADLDGELTPLKNKYAYLEKAFQNRDRQYAEAKLILKSLIENEEISDEEAVKQLVEIFGIEILKTVDFTLTIEVTGSVEIPMGSELDEYSFSLDSLSYEGVEVSIDHETIAIEGWDFAE